MKRAPKSTSIEALKRMINELPEEYMPYVRAVVRLLYVGTTGSRGKYSIPEIESAIRTARASLAWPHLPKSAAAAIRSAIRGAAPLCR